MKTLLTIFVFIGLKFYELIVTPIWWIIKAPFRFLKWFLFGKSMPDNTFIFANGWKEYYVWSLGLRYIAFAALLMLIMFVGVFEIIAVQLLSLISTIEIPVKN